MLKRFCVLFIALAVFGECSVTTFPKTHTQPEWEAHVKDFIKLIDVQKLMAIAVNYISDPEVMNFVEFLLSPEFKKIIWEIEIMPEFREVSNITQLCSIILFCLCPLNCNFYFRLMDI